MEVILRSCWPGTIYSIPKHVRISNRRSNRNTWPILLYVTENPGEGRGGVETAKQLLLKSLLESSIERAESPAIDGAHDREIFLRTDNEFSVASGHSEVYDAFFRTSVADITATATAIWVPTTSLVPRNLAHLATWEWITLWLIVLMLLNTLLYNGFIGGATPISDRYTRLFLVSTYRANAEPEVITYDRHEESDEEEYDEEENVDDADAEDSEEFPWPVRNVPAKGIFYSKRKPESGAQGLTPEGTRNRTASGGHSANDNDGENRKDADVLDDTEQEEKNDLNWWDLEKPETFKDSG
ncbi:hypothetical protein BKA61DRAFT_674825 [Leptodontidium sp. MPI-SDFR-AT-0119]|nr:hypothetical protein BKA61DRAFT_674825 [Leptodontidium sp. MPI-SDFR-AT-0119]